MTFDFPPPYLFAGPPPFSALAAAHINPLVFHNLWWALVPPPMVFELRLRSQALVPLTYSPFSNSIIPLNLPYLHGYLRLYVNGGVKAFFPVISCPVLRRRAHVPYPVRSPSSIGSS